MHSRQGRSGLTEQWPWIIALTFGLLHGLGFAGALSDVGLPAGHIPLALLFFSCGVETGQFLFIAAVLTLRGAGPQGPGAVPALGGTRAALCDRHHRHVLGHPEDFNFLTHYPRDLRVEISLARSANFHEAR